MIVIVKYVSTMDELRAKFNHYKELLKHKSNRNNSVIGQFEYDPRVEYSNVNKGHKLVFKLRTIHTHNTHNTHNLDSNLRNLN